ncbi:unnamed protein product [Eruca vesicaria subsp. sativa]|uniref:BZIP domain-containing protein n=1 Tax=Eruca vesicaria subsp. sativa TaxID=29727 RepID=A0ABC8J658_ERUVS|nr:unnamed protein product [Eruca vesicaria subsp. sativa]
MAQLPPKIPTMTTTTTPHWPDFSSQKLPSIAAAAATAGQQNPSWMDEFLDFSSTRRGTHRRSISDSIAFLEPPSSSGVGNHHFDRFDDEQFMSMFNDDVHQNHHHNSVNGNVGHTRSSSNTSLPSDQNSLSENDNKEQPPSDDHDHMDTTTANDDNNVAGNNYNESDEVQSHCKTEPQDGPSSTNQNSDTRIHDPKRVKRILANRQSAQRSRVRKLQYISELERSVTSLQTEVSVLSPRVAFLDHQRLLLNVDNSTIKQRIAALAQDKIFKDAHQEALKREIERLRQVYHQQSLKKMENNISDQSPADIKPSIEKERPLNA